MLSAHLLPHLIIVELKRRSLTALCLMLLEPEGYRMPTQELRVTLPMQRGLDIAQDLFACMGYKDINDGHPYSSQATCYDPGEDFPWLDGLEKWLDNR